MNRKKVRIIIVALTVLVLAALVTIVLVYRASHGDGVKTGVVKSVYNESYRDGCDGFKLENGDKVNTFCFWTKPEDQTEYDGETINVGDTVEYGTEAGKQFIRLKR